MTYSSTVLADTPVAYYRLGESSGTTMTDSSGNSRDGTYTSVTLGATGAVAGDTAATWSGTTGQRGDVTYASWQSQTSFTIEALIKPASVTSTITIASRYWTSFGGSSFSFRLDSDGVLRLYLFTGASFSTIAATYTFTVGTWYHVAAAVTSGVGTTIYVNGMAVGTSGLNAFNATTAPFCVGARSHDGVNPGAEPWNGTLDEVAYYGSALSAGALANHYVQSGLYSKGYYDTVVLADSPLTYLPLDESAGTVARDLSGNNHPGTYNGGTKNQTKVMPTGTASFLSNSSSEYVKLPVASWINQASFTVECWVSLTSVSSLHNIFNRDGVTARGWNLYSNGTELDGYNGTSDINTTGAGLATSTPYLLAVTSDGSTLKIYKNGVLQRSTTATGGWTTNASGSSTSNDLMIGCSYAGTGTAQLPTNGTLERYAYYGSVLTATQLQAHYTASSGLPPLIATSTLTATASATTAVYAASTSGAATTTVTKPSGLATGDHLLIYTFEANTTLTLSGSTFTSLGDYVVQDGNTNTVHAFYRQIDSTESSSFTASATCNYVAVAYRGGSGPPAILNGTGRVTSGTGTDTTIPGRFIAPVAGLVVNVFAGSSSSGGSGGIITTPPAGVTSRRTTSSASFWSMNISEEVATAGQDTSRTASTDRNNAGLHLAFMIPDSGTLPAAIGGNIYNSGSSTNATLTVPSYAQAGDLFIAGYEVTSNTISAGVTGFTAIDGPNSFTGGTFSSGSWWGYKILVSGDVGAAQAVTSGSQVWGAVGVLIRNPAGTPIKATGTMTHGTSTTPSLVGVTSTTTGSIAVSALMASQAGGGAVMGKIDPSTVKGVFFHSSGIVNSGYGTVGLAVHAVAPGGTSLAPATTIPSAPTWETNTLLLTVGESTAAAALTATSTLTATATQTFFAAAALTATSTLTDAGIVTKLGAATLTGTSTLTAAAVVTKPGVVSLTATSTLTSAAVVTKLGVAALSATSTLTAAATGIVIYNGVVALQATSTLTATVTRTAFAGATLTATATLTTAATVTAGGGGGGSTSGYDTAVLALNPTHYYETNETTGTSFNDSGSGNNDGTLTGTHAVLGTTILAEKGVEFTSDDTYVSAAIGSIGVAGSWSCLIKVYSDTGNFARVGYATGGDNTPSDNGERDLGLGFGQAVYSSEGVGPGGGASMPVGEYHLVGTQAAGGAQVLYVNGVSSTTGSYTPGTASGGALYFPLGAFDNGVPHVAIGKVAFWDGVVLTSGNVATLYAALGTTTGGGTGAALNLAGTSQTGTWNIGLGQPLTPPGTDLVILDSVQKKAPTSLQILIYNCYAGEVLTLSVGGVDLYTVTADSDGYVSQTSIPIYETTGLTLPAGTYTLTATGSSTVVTAEFTLSQDPDAQEVIQGVDVDPVEIPEATATPTRRWVLQDLLPGGLGSWAMPINPASVDWPGVSKTLTPTHATAVTGTRYVTQGTHVGFPVSFSGYCPNQAFQEQLEAYAALERRIYVIDDQNRAWTIGILGADIKLRKRQVNDDGSNQDWAADYTVNCWLFRPTYKTPVTP